MITALIIFAATYAVMIALPKYRTHAAVISAACFILSGILPLRAAMFQIQWNVILMIGGTMGVVSLFIASKMPARLADIIIAHVPDLRMAAVALSLFASLISALVDNVATVLMIAPVAMAIAKKQRADPVPIIIAISVSSNLQGAATLVGDTTSILLGNYAHMDFLDFFFFRGRPGIFWVVQISCLFTILILMFIFRDLRQKLIPTEKAEVHDYFPTVLLCALVVLLIGASFIPNKPENTNGYICTALFAIGLLREFIRGNRGDALNALREIDIQTLILLTALFVVIGGITNAGVIDAFSNAFIQLSGDNMLVCYTLIVAFSVVASAFVDNIPYIATMLPVVTSIAAAAGKPPFLLYYGLLIGATLGGNLTPIGASANITAIGLLRKDGYAVKNRDFLKIGVPLTLAAVVVGYILLLVVWG